MQQEVELFVAPDKWRRLRAQCFEAAPDATLSDHTPGALRLAKTGERLWAEILDLEQCADLSPRALGNDERAWLSKRLEPGSQVRGLVDNSALLCCTRANQIADHDQPAGDAEPHVQPLQRRETADRVDNGEPGADRPLGIVLIALPGSRNRSALRRPCTWRQNRRNGRPCRRHSGDKRRSPRADPRDRSAPTAASSRLDRKTSPSAAGARHRWEPVHQRAPPSPWWWAPGRRARRWHPAACAGGRSLQRRSL